MILSRQGMEKRADKAEEQVATMKEIGIKAL
jgi:hypothetical protein